MYLCILDGAGQVVFDKNLAADPDAFLKAIAPFRDGLVVGVECLFCWYWLADLCAREQADQAGNPLPTGAGDVGRSNPVGGGAGAGH
jgi:hypothetical protein